MNTSWTVKKRISIGFTIVILLTAAVGIVGIVSLSSINRLTTTLVKEDMPGALTMSAMKDNLSQGYAYVERHLRVSDEAGMKDTEEKYLRLFGQNQELSATYEKAITNAEDRARFSDLNRIIDAYGVARKELFRLSYSGDKKAALAYMQSVFLPEYRKYRTVLDDYVTWNVRNATMAGDSASSRVTAAISGISVTLAIACIFAIICSIIIVSKIDKVLSSAIKALTDGSEQVAAASAEVSSASNSLAQGASEQAASLEETSSSIEEMSSMTSNNAESARHAKSLAEEMRSAADDSSEHMQQMQIAMDAIKESSVGISQIIKTIDDIAFQTNILALNAAVEAARAGEAGAGFAVVADEVRSLAQRSAKSAKETSAKIEGAMRNSEQGVKISTQVATSLSDIVKKARSMNTVVSEIAQATEEQSRGISEISKAVTQIDQVTQSSASSAEETAAASEQLNANADTLLDTVGDLLALVQKSVNSANANAGRRHLLIGIGKEPDEHFLDSGKSTAKTGNFIMHDKHGRKMISK